MRLSDAALQASAMDLEESKWVSTCGDGDDMSQEGPQVFTEDRNWE